MSQRPGVVVVLDGPSSVGRSTTLFALQHGWPQVRPGPLLDVGLDATLARFGPAQRRWRDLVLADPRSRTGGGPAQLVWGPLGRELVPGMHRAAAAWANAGFDVVIDHVLFDHATVADLLAVLEGLVVVHVGLICDPDVLEDREREDPTRRPGSAVAQLQASRPVATRDLVLDTTQSTTEELAAEILAEVARRLLG